MMIDVEDIQPKEHTMILLTKQQVVKLAAAIDESMQRVMKAEAEGQEIKGLMLMTVPELAESVIRVSIWRQDEAQ